MKKRIILIVSIAIVFLLCVPLVIENVLEMDITATKREEILKQNSSEDESWTKISKGEIAIENNSYLLQMDSETTHFIVTHKESGKVFYSVPQAADGFEPKAEQMSEVLVTYYGSSDSSKATMNSYENSVEGQSYEIKTDGSVIRVYYSIQKSKQKLFVPLVLGQEVFEEKLLAKMESGPKRRLKSFYTLYESKNNDSDTEKMKKTYPALKDENLYILSESAGERTYSEITKYFEKAEYGAAEYAREAERLGLEGSISDNLPAAFVVPVEYALTDNGFSATVLTDKITSDSDSFKLTNISLLPYFASSGYSEIGWQLVPDGSGAIIELAEKAGSTYFQTIWNNDLAVEQSINASMQQNVGMPVFGFHDGNNAFLGVISGGAAVASVNAEIYGNEFTQSHIYTDFNVLAFDSSDEALALQSNTAAFNLYAKEYVAEFPQITYLLFPDKETTYSDMAVSYREYLIQSGVLVKRLKEQEEVPVYLDFTGYETVDQTIMGIATKAKTSLSTLEKIDEALVELASRDVAGIHVRLKAYSNEGLYGMVSNGFEIDKCVGSQKELDKMAQYLVNQGGRLYLENNISTVHTSGNSFQKMTHAVRTLKRTVAKGMDLDLVSHTMANYEYYLTSPAYFQSLTENFIKTLEEESECATIYGYSWSDFGSKLWSDFNRQHSYDRTQAVDASLKATALAEENFAEILTDGSHAYVLTQADTILNLPLNSSELSSESYSVPFYQMVIHGYIDYSGAPINVSADAHKTYLASIESGANLYYSYYTADNQPLMETEAGTLTYPTWIQDSYDDVEEQYKEFQSIFRTLRCQLITEHQRVAKDVFVTTYENGTEIVVNYSNKDYMLEDRIIPAQGFDVTEGREK